MNRNILCLAIVSALVALTGMSPVLPDHSGHQPIPIPKSWSDARFKAFVKRSDDQIDKWMGYTVPPGTVVTYEGLKFWKSAPGEERKSCKKYCKVRKVCHDDDKI